MILMLIKIFAMHATKKTHQAMMMIQKMRRRSLSECNVVNVRDGITKIVWMTDAIHVSFVMTENIVAIRNYGYIHALKTLFPYSL